MFDKHELKKDTLAENKIPVTPLGYDNFLRKVEEKALNLADKRKLMGQLGRQDFDLRENAYYMDLRREVQHDDAEQLFRYRQMASKAVLVRNVCRGLIDFSTIFSARVVEPGEQPKLQYFQLLGPLERLVLGTVYDEIEITSVSSPLGSALWGVAPTTSPTINVDVGRGHIIRLENIRLSYETNDYSLPFNNEEDLAA